MKRLIAQVALIWALATGSAVAADGPVVVELYTSQGCSSCPPADKLLGEIANRNDVIALALHVDYWDYIGWKDEFASPAYTQRQRGYARAAGDRSIYTPQMIVGGVDHVIGNRPMKLAEAMQRHARIAKPVGVRLTRQGDSVLIEASADGRLPSDGAIVQLAIYLPKANVDIRRGENAGRTLTYHNVVRNLVEVGKWDGRSAYRASVKVPSGQPVAVLIQSPGHGPMLGAAKLR